MTNLSLREAAEMAGVSKSTIFRAIKAGRLSAGRSDDGEFQIDAAELHRAYPLKGATVSAERSTTSTPGQDATHDATRELHVLHQLALAEAELKSLRVLADELRAQRDGWQSQAERVTLALSGPSEGRQPWWRRLAG